MKASWNWLACMTLLGACSKGLSSDPIGTERQGGENGNPGSGGTRSNSTLLFLDGGGVLKPVDSGGGANLSSDGANCGISRERFSIFPVDLLVVQDRSGSMRSNEKWLQTTTAVKTVISETETGLRWGLKLFAMPHATNTAVRCFVPDGVQVPFDFNNAAKIIASMDANPPPNSDNGSATPTRWAIQKAVEYLKTVNDGSPKYILLSTDGQPNCKNGINSTSDYGVDDAAATIDAIAQAKKEGIPVAVVGFAIGTTGPFLSNAEITLNAMAEAGGLARNDPTYKYYPANDSASLVIALKQIVGILPTCGITFPERPRVPDNIAIDAIPPAPATDKDKRRIPQNATNGWQYTDDTMTKVKINGSYCDEILAGKIERLEAIFGCPGVPIP